MKGVRIGLYSVLAFFFLAAFIVPAAAEKRYISDTIEITLRRGPGTDHSIISMIETGQAAELLETGKNWSRVRLDENRSGWVLNRFLSTEKPSRIRLAELQARYSELEKIASDPMKENRTLKLENRQQAESLTAMEADLLQAKTALEQLEKESATYLRLKSMHEQVTRRLAEQSTLLVKTETELEALRKEKIFRWFLSGAGVLLLGFLIGMSARRNRRRSTLR